MPWSYEAPERDSGWIDGNTQLSWRNHWIITELSPTVPGYIRLQVEVFTDDYFTIPAGYRWYFTDVVTLDGETVTIHNQYLAPLEYSTIIQIPSSWSGKSARFNIAGRGVDIPIGALAVYQLSITEGTNSQIEVRRNGSTLLDGSIVSSGDELIISFSSSPGYDLTTHSVNGAEFASGNTYTVTSDVVVVSAAVTKTYTLSVSQGNNINLLINRVDSPYEGAAQGYLSNGATLYYGDVVSISYSASTGYSITTHTLNGSDFDSGTVISISDSIYVAVDSILNTYNISVHIDEHITLSVQRTSSPLGGGRTGLITLSEDTVYHGDVLVITALPGSGYGVDSMTLNGDSVSNPYTATIVSSLIIVVLEKALGFLYIDSGSSIEKYKIVIDSGSALDQYRAMIDIGSAIIPY